MRNVILIITAKIVEEKIEKTYDRVPFCSHKLPVSSPRLRIMTVESTRRCHSMAWQNYAVASCVLSGVSLGMIIGWLAPTLAKLQSGVDGLKLESDQIFWVTMIAQAAHVGSPFFVSYPMDHIGRKRVLLLAGLSGVCSWILTALSFNVEILYVSRLFAGLSIGISLCCATTYLAEIAPNSSRGALVFFYAISIQAGLLFMFVAGSELDMFWCAIVGLSMSALFVLTFAFMPESPHYYAMRGYTRNAKHSLMRLRGESYNESEFDSVVRAVEDKRSSGGTYRDLVDDPGNRRSLIIVTLCTVCQELGGCVCLLAYVTIIFQAMGDLIPAENVTIVFAVVQLIGGLFSALLVDRTGRRNLLAISGYTCGACCFLVSGLFFGKEYLDYSTDVTYYTSVLALLVFIFSFTSGVMTVPSVLRAELFPTELRAKVAFVCAVGTALMAVVVVQSYLPVSRNWGHSPPFLFFAAINLSTVTVVLRLLPETKGKTLEEITALMHPLPKINTKTELSRC